MKKFLLGVFVGVIVIALIAFVGLVRFQVEGQHKSNWEDGSGLVGFYYCTPGQPCDNPDWWIDWVEVWGLDG